MTPITAKDVPTYTTKVKINELLKKYEKGLAAIAWVHLRGSKKYPWYGWINKPHETNSSPEDNFDALWRHFSSHTMGKITDEEGLPHIFHMCCRSGMFVTTIYRHLNHEKYELKSPLPYIDHTPFGAFITPEEVWTLTKSSYAGVPTTYEELGPYINEQLLKFWAEYKDCPKMEPDVTSFTMHGVWDDIFIGCMEYMNAFCQRHDVFNYINNFKDLPEDEKYYYGKFII